MARPTSRKKSDLSKAVAELRALFGESQQAFANRLKIALNTIARYETSRPPRGDVLLKMAEIAEKRGAYPLRDSFRTAYLEQMEELKFQLLMVPQTGSRPAYGFLFKRLEGGQGLRAGHYCLTILECICSKDVDRSKRALEGLKALAKECNANSHVDEIAEPIITAISEGSK